MRFGLPAGVVLAGCALAAWLSGPENAPVAATTAAVTADLAPATTPAVARVVQPEPDRLSELSALRHKVSAIVVGDGDTLLDILLRSGADRVQATAALLALRRVYDPRELKVGQRVDVKFDTAQDGARAPALEQIALISEPGRRVESNRSGDGFEATANRLPELREFAHFAGTIKTSLFESAVAQGVPPQVLAAMIAAYSYDVDFQRDLQPGDSFELMYQRTVDGDGNIVRAGDIVYADLVLSGKHMPIYRYVDLAHRVDFYNAKGESVRKALLRTPVDGARITSGFGMRVNPILGFSMLHKGVDFGVPAGTPVMAAGSGMVEKAGENGAYGLYIRLRHDPVHGTAYAHLSKIAKGIRAGAHVKQGDVIGYVGETGRATGPHLHYEVLVNNQQVNPMSVKFKSGIVLAGKELDRFKSVVGEDEQRLASTPLSERVAMAKKAE